MTLKEARLKKNLSQSGLAANTGLTQGTLSLIETGKATPQADTRRRIERALGCRVNWLTTMGLLTRREGQLSSWEHVEQTFRNALHEMNGLRTAELMEFLDLAEEYLAEFKAEALAKREGTSTRKGRKA